MSARWPLASFIGMGVFWGTWAALVPDIKAQVGASDGELGLAMVGVGIGSLPAMVLTGRLWRRFGWWLVPATAGLFAVATLGPIFASTPLLLGVSLLFVGATSGAFDVAINSSVSDVEVLTDRRLMYAAHALFSLAVLVSSVATGILREAGAGPAVGLGVAAVVFVFVAVGSSTAARRAVVAAQESIEAAAEGGTKLMVGLLATIAVLCAMSFLIEDAIQNWSSLLLERELGTSPAVGGAGPGAFAAAMFVGRSAGQWLGGRFSDRLLLTSGGAIAALGLVLAATASSAPVALVGLAMGGGGVALVAPALFARAGRLADASSRGATIATMTTVGYTGFVAGPIVIGLVAQAAGLRAAFLLMALMAAALAVAGALVLRGASPPAEFGVGEELLKTGRA